MSTRPPTNPRSRITERRNAVLKARRSRRAGLAVRTQLVESEPGPFSPPEDWHEPAESGGAYRIIEQQAGDGHRHVVTPDDIRERLACLPAPMTERLEVVQLSRMTRKKQTFPCYGMQWGTAIYLYPMETSLLEQFSRPPKPNQENETRMYGGSWDHVPPDTWRLQWSEASIKDFYLNNILIHELGHLLDDRNRSYQDRERYAEWFAIEYGYKPSRRKSLARRAAAKIVRRHHAK